MKTFRYLAPTAILVAVAVLFVNATLSTDDSEPGFASAIVVKAAAAQEKKHGGDIIFETKKNKQNLLKNNKEANQGSLKEPVIST